MRVQFWRSVFYELYMKTSQNRINGFNFFFILLLLNDVNLFRQGRLPRRPLRPCVSEIIKKTLFLLCKKTEIGINTIVPNKYLNGSDSDCDFDPYY